MCVCVCVWEREKEGERERKGESEWKSERENGRAGMFSFRIMKNELKTEALKPNKPKHVCLRPLKKIFKFVIYIKMDNSIYIPQMEFATSKVQHLLIASVHD